MQPPAIPPDEISRLLALHKLQILDSAGEERFDRITRITKRIFDVDICLLSLVDTNRQWFKSRQGLEASETERDISFCGHAILDDEEFVVDDAHADSRFADNPLVTESPHIRFYAGQPLRGPQGYRVGTLCVIDRKPRPFSVEDRSTLRDLSALIEIELNSVPQTIVDEVTNIPNRRGFDAVSRHLFNLCRRVEVEFQAIIVRIDEISQGNDEESRSKRCSELRRFSENLIEIFPTADLVARIADNKFAVLVCADPEASESGLSQLGNQLNEQKSSSDNEISWSVGSVDFDPVKHLSIESVLNEADKLMQQSSSCR